MGGQAVGWRTATKRRRAAQAAGARGALLLTAAWAYPPRHIGRWAWGTLQAWAGLNPVRASVWPPGPPGVGAAGSCSGPGRPGGWRLSGLSLFERLGVVRRGLVLWSWFGFRRPESRQLPWVPWSLCAFPSAPPPGAPCVQPLRARVKASPSQQRPHPPAANVPWRVCPSSHKQQPRQFWWGHVLIFRKSSRSHSPWACAFGFFS